MPLKRSLKNRFPADSIIIVICKLAWNHDSPEEPRVDNHRQTARRGEVDEGTLVGIAGWGGGLYFFGGYVLHQQQFWPANQRSGNCQPLSNWGK